MKPRIPNILLFVLSVLGAFRAAAQCTPPGGVLVVACGTGTALTNNAVISSGTFNATGGTFTGVTLSGGTLVLCGTVTLTNFTLNSGNMVINAGATVAFTGTYNSSGGSFYNSGSVTFGTNIALQGTAALAYNAPGGVITTTGSITVFNSGVFFQNGTANAQSVTINTGAGICLGPNSVSNVTNFQNNQTNSVSVPSGTACIHYTGSFAANNPVISVSAKLILCQAPGATAPTGNFGAATVISNCSSCPLGALPIELESFNGKLIGTRVDLEWVTALEEDLKSFAVQQSTDGQHFRTIDTVAAHDQPSSYDFTTSIDANSYFRLQMIDKDGKFTYSPIVVIELPVAGFQMTILSNPVLQSLLSVSVSTPNGQKGQLIVLDNVGRPLKELPVTLMAGKNDLQLSLDGLSAGFYYLRFIGGSGISKTVSFIKL
ncbi:MAG TPA: hypothetical protein VNU70_07100 [Puia sp.]|nr:hypothetical protein [Puia sp.]